jgi:S-adenosylmethionine:tRNA ribosyltransferase-isomerase
LKTSDFDYILPSEYIAQDPVEPRDNSRLMILDRKSGSVSHSVFNQIGDHLNPGDLLVLNETRVIPARLYASKFPGGGRVELLLLHKVDELSWEVLVGGKGAKVGRQLKVDDGPEAGVIEILSGARRLIRFQEQIEGFLP